MEQMNNTGAEKSAPFVLGPMKASDVFQMVRILRVLGFNEIGKLLDPKKRKDLAFKKPQTRGNGGGLVDLPRDKWTEAMIAAETRYQVAMSSLLMEVIGMILDHITDPECEKAIFTLLASCTGATVEEIRNMDAVCFIDLLDQYVSREEFSDFFMRAWKLLSRSGNTGSQISSSVATAIRSL